MATLLVVVAVLGLVTSGVTAQAQNITRGVQCLVHQVLSTAGSESCDQDTTAGSGWSTGGSTASPSPSPTGSATAPPTTAAPVVCPNDVQTGPPSASGAPWRLITIGCRYVPVPPSCGHALEEAGYDPGRPIPAEEQLAPVRDCVGGVTGPAVPDQDDPTCSGSQPNRAASGDPTVVQVGCRDYVVPQVCKGRWDRFRASEPATAEAASLGLDLAACVTTWYARAEIPCVVSQTLEVDRSEVVALFFLKVSDEKAMLVEQLGDGKMRVHLLTGSQLGGQFSTPDGTGPKFEVARLSGYEKDDTFEFPDAASAQTWIDWFKKREDRAVYGQGGYANYLQQSDPLSAEPPRRKHSESTTDKTNVTTKLTVDSTSAIPGIPGRGSKAGTVSGANGVVYQKESAQEVEVEDRLLTDPAGTRVQTYKTSDTQAATLLLKLGGKVARVGAEFQMALEGGEVKGTLSLTQVRKADGSLDRIVLSVDDTLMTTLKKYKVDLSTILPYGFSANIGGSYAQEEGTASLTQVVLNAENLTPDELVRATVLSDTIFPRDDDGTLSGDDVELGDAYDELAGLVRSNGTTRTSGYDVDRTTTTITAGLSLVGLPIISGTNISVTENQELSSSTLEVVDVGGRTRPVNPAPACSLPSVDPATYDFDDPNDPSTPPYDQGWWS